MNYLQLQVAHEGFNLGSRVIDEVKMDRLLAVSHKGLEMKRENPLPNRPQRRVMADADRRDLPVDQFFAI